MTNVFPSYSSQLVGCWKCISYELFAVDDDDDENNNKHSSGSDSGNNSNNSNNTPKTKTLLAKPHGDHPVGRVSISPQGWLAAHLTRPDRVEDWRKGAEGARVWQTASDADVANVARGMAMYCGYMKLYEGEGAGLFWQTKVEVASDPGRIGGIEERKVTLEREGGREFMVLEPKQDMVMEDGTRTRAVLKWVKFE